MNSSLQGLVGLEAGCAELSSFTAFNLIVKAAKSDFSLLEYPAVSLSSPFCLWLVVHVQGSMHILECKTFRNHCQFKCFGFGVA